MHKNAYQHYIDGIPLLSKQQEFDLVRKAKSGDKMALDTLVKHNLRFVVSVAKQYRGQGMPMDDLIQEGNIGLIRAAKRFDEKKNFKFISYAVWWIRQAIVYALSKQSRIVNVPYNKIGVITKTMRRESQLEQTHKGRVSRDAIAQDMQTTRCAVDTALQYINSNSTPLSTPLPGRQYLTLADTIADTQDSVEDVLHNAQFAEHIRRTIRMHVTPRQYTILSLLYGFDCGAPLTQKEAASHLSCSRQAIQQSVRAATRTLRSALPEVLTTENS